MSQRSRSKFFSSGCMDCNANVLYSLLKAVHILHNGCLRFVDVNYGIRFKSKGQKQSTNEPRHVISNNVAF